MLRWLGLTKHGLSAMMHVPLPGYPGLPLGMNPTPGTLRRHRQPSHLLSGYPRRRLCVPGPCSRPLRFLCQPPPLAPRRRQPHLQGLPRALRRLKCFLQRLHPRLEAAQLRLGPTHNVVDLRRSNDDDEGCKRRGIPCFRDTSCSKGAMPLADGHKAALACLASPCACRAAALSRRNRVASSLSDAFSSINVLSFSAS